VKFGANRRINASKDRLVGRLLIERSRRRCSRRVNGARQASGSSSQARAKISSIASPP